MKKLFVIFAAIAMVGAFTATAMAADWSFYGNARMKTFYEGYSEESTTTGDSESQVNWDMQTNSRIGGRVDAGDIQGVFEYGFTGDPGDNVNARLLYARWNWNDSGYLLLGQAYTPVSYWVGSQVYASDTGLIGFGAPYGDRDAQIKVVVGGFRLAAIRNSGAYGYDTFLPKLEARYDFAFGNNSIGIFGGYQTYEDNAADDSVDSLMYGIGYTGSFGPGWLNAALSGGTNMANANWGGSYLHAAAAGGEDTTSMAFAIAGGMATSETMGFQIGFGYLADENEDVGPDTDDSMTVYAQMNWTVAPGFTVYPEIGYVDNMKGMNDEDQGNLLYAGAKWQMNF